eukprot:g4371.t1
MRAVVVENAKAAPSIRGAMRVVSDYALPSLSSTHNVLVKVHYTAVNRADLLQRVGKYPPPPGASDIMGLECSGEVVEVSETDNHNPPPAPASTNKWRVGDRVMGLLEGGGYAEYAACAPGSLMRVPDYVSLKQAACVPEVWLTAYQLLRRVADLKKNENLLLHAGASAVSLAGIQIAKQVIFCKNVTALTRSEGKLALCRKVGADHALLRSEFFGAKQGEAGAKQEEATKFDVILDPVVGPEFFKCLSEATNRDARYVVYAAMGGAKVPDFNFGPVFRKSLSVLTSTLRARSVAYKRELVADFSMDVLERYLFAGRDEDLESKLNLDTVFPLEQVADAHERLEVNDTGGKIVLQVVQQGEGD